MMWKSRITAIAGVAAAMLAATALGASPAGAVTPNAPGICTPTGCTCTPTTCQPIKKPPPQPYPYPMPAGFSISYELIGLGTSNPNYLTVHGQGFLTGTTAEVSFTQDGSGLITTQAVTVPPGGSFTIPFGYLTSSGTYHVWADDYIGPEWISPMSNQLSFTLL